jgi:hypothetical protein
MTDTYKKLAAIAPTNDEEKFLYAAPAATSSLVSNITVANRSSSSATFDINIYQSGITQQSDIDNSDLGKVFVTTGREGSSQFSSLSTNGITWTARSLPSSTGWNGSGAGSYYISSTTANQDYIFKSTPILGNETITVKAGYTMSQNDQVRVRSNNGTSNFNIFGGEI